MLKINKFFIFILSALLVCGAIFFTGCVRRNMPVAFDSSDPLALEPYVEWAVVHDPYAAFRREPSYSSEITGHCRQSAVLRVEGRMSFNSKDDESVNGRWYAFKDGWLPASSLDVYSNKFKAEKASAAYIKK